jgi:hypothetical protein
VIPTIALGCCVGVLDAGCAPSVASVGLSRDQRLRTVDTPAAIAPPVARGEPVPFQHAPELSIVDKLCLAPPVDTSRVALRPVPRSQVEALVEIPGSSDCVLMDASYRTMPFLHWGSIDTVMVFRSFGYPALRFEGVWEFEQVAIGDGVEYSDPPRLLDPPPIVNVALLAADDGTMWLRYFCGGEGLARFAQLNPIAVGSSEAALASCEAMRSQNRTRP